MTSIELLMIIGMCLLVVWNIFLTWLLGVNVRLFKNLSKNVTKKDLLTILKEIIASLRGASDRIEELENLSKSLNSLKGRYLTNIGFVRYNPFSDTGGDQSFSLCVLSGNRRGFILTSLHSRSLTRLYAKEVLSDTINKEEFSEEEIQAYKKAVEVIAVKDKHE